MLFVIIIFKISIPWLQKPKSVQTKQSVVSFSAESFWGSDEKKMLDKLSRLAPEC